MSPRTPDVVSRPAMLLVAGRVVGFAAAFAIPVVLARHFTQAEFGTYKQLFLIFGTAYGLAQLGMAESLYYFLPKRPAAAGRHVANAVVTLAGIGGACLLILWGARDAIAGLLSNPVLAGHMGVIGLFLALMLASAGFEIVLISRNRHKSAAWTYAASDLARTALLLAPALLVGGVRGLLLGAVAFAALRLAAMLVWAWRSFGADLRIDRVLLGQQLAYALPFAMAVGVEVLQLNFHQYVVASQVDAAMFAVYAVGCLQIPLVDFIATSTSSVMMVKMAEHAASGDGRAESLALWHLTVRRLAWLIFPLAALMLLAARPLILTLFTASYAASVPIFMVWSLTMIPTVLVVDAVLRVHAETRFLFVMNVLRLGVVAALIWWMLSAFGMPGAVLAMLAASVVARTAGLVRIARLMDVGPSALLPWRALAGIAARAAIAGLPVVILNRVVTMPAPAALVATGLVYVAGYLALSGGSALREHAAARMPVYS